jgi:AcrR family transcriptional regulator
MAQARKRVEEQGPLRRQPTQQRSRERAERILACARELIAESGSDAMRMSEVAERAGISIGSLYQYFPDKSAIIHALAQQSNAASRACIEEGLADVRTLNALCEAFGGLIDTYYEIFLAEPVMRDIWSATQADPALRAMDLAESKAHAALLAAALRRVKPSASAADIDASALLIMHLGESAMRLAVSVDRKEGAAIIAGFKRMVSAELRRK